MSNSSVTIIGNLTRDPEIKTFDSGTSVVEFGVAVNKSWKNKDNEWVEEVSFFSVKAFRDLAEQSKLLEKGVRVIVNGELKQESWEGDKGPQSKVIVNARDIAVSLQGIDGYSRRPKAEKGNFVPAQKASGRPTFDSSDEPF